MSIHKRDSGNFYCVCVHDGIIDNVCNPSGRIKMVYFPTNRTCYLFGFLTYHPRLYINGLIHIHVYINFPSNLIIIIPFEKLYTKFVEQQIIHVTLSFAVVCT